MAEIVVVPQQGNSVESVILLTWHKAEGDTVAAGEVLCEVETDKTTMEVESTVDGTLLKRMAAEGDEVAVKTALAVVGAPGEEIPIEASAPAGSPAQSSSSAPAASSAQDAAPTPSAAPAMGAHPEAAAAPTTTASGGAVSPRARATAEREAVDPAHLTGTGPGGRVIERDVLAARDAQQGTGLGGRASSADRAAAAAATAAPAAPSVALASRGPAEIRQEIRVQGIRRVIAERMRDSLASTAQLTIHGSADARALQRLRHRFKEAGAPLGMERISINDMMLFVVARTLDAFPALNAHFTGDVIRTYSGVDLSFAVDTERGLLVPTIQGAHGLSLRELSVTAREMAEQCIAGRATPEILAPGTFTVTNLGSFGVEYFTPVINPPQVAILGINTISLKAVATADGSVEHIPHIGLSLTIDHQAVDGAPAARFMQALSQRIAAIDLVLGV